MVGASGFEPPASWSRTRRASQAALRPDDTHSGELNKRPEWNTQNSIALRANLERGGHARDSIRRLNQTAASPQNGRPLQNPTPKWHNGFVAAVPSRVFRDGTGIFEVKLCRHQALPHRTWRRM